MGLLLLWRKRYLKCTAIKSARKIFLGGDIVNTIRPISNQSRNPGQIMSQDSQNMATMQKAVELINTQKRLGLSLTMFDKNLHKISGKFNSMADLLRNPDFIAHLNQDIYVSNDSETTWFKLKVRNGKIEPITFLLTFHTNWVKNYNNGPEGFETIVVGYSPGEGEVTAATAVVPGKDFTPERITQHFQLLIG